MKLSHEKIAHIVDRCLERLLDDDRIDFKMPEARMRSGLERVLEEDLQIEDEISTEAIARIDSIKRDIPYGSDEWRVLYERYFREIADRRGYTL